jgi:hypothetical protein
VRQHLGAPLLGVVPELTGDQHPNLVILNTDLDQRFVEGYRVIRTALNYSWSEPGARIITITSTGPGEGKTLTAVNLASPRARGSRLLIDADLRNRPRTLSCGQEAPGLSDVLVGKASLGVDADLQGTNLSYLPSGTHAPSPADLLTNRTMRGLLEGLRKFYDWIITHFRGAGNHNWPPRRLPWSWREMVPGRPSAHRAHPRHRSSHPGLVLNRAQVDKHPTTTATITATTTASTTARPRPRRITVTLEKSRAKGACVAIPGRSCSFSSLVLVVKTSPPQHPPNLLHLQPRLPIIAGTGELQRRWQPRLRRHHRQLQLELRRRHT